MAHTLNHVLSHSLFFPPFHGYNYEGQRAQVIHANSKINFGELNRRINLITGWLEVIYDFGINAQWQVGRGENICFVLIPISNDEFLRSVISNTQGGKID